MLPRATLLSPDDNVIFNLDSDFDELETEDEDPQPKAQILVDPMQKPLSVASGASGRSLGTQAEAPKSLGRSSETKAPTSESRRRSSEIQVPVPKPSEATGKGKSQSGSQTKAPKHQKTVVLKEAWGLKSL